MDLARSCATTEPWRALPDLIEFCQTHSMKMLTVAELIRYRMQHERYVHRVGEALIGTRYGEFRLIAYESEVDGGESHVDSSAWRYWKEATSSVLEPAGIRLT